MMKNLVKIGVLVLVTLLIFQCEKDVNEIMDPDDPPKDDTTLVDTLDIDTTGIDTTVITDPDEEELITLIFIGDSEPRMRNNTNAEVRHYIEQLVRLKKENLLFFDYKESKYPIKPEIVLLGGDISADRSTSVANDMPLWQVLYNNNILFLAGFGNHDWDPDFFGDDGPGYSLAGHTSNENTKLFCRESYRRSAQVSSKFTYRELNPTSTHGPVTFHADYKGIKIVNFNTFLYHPSYYYPAGWPLNCNLLAGGAGCQVFVSAENQIQKMEDIVFQDTSSTHIFFQHYPVLSSSWWNDYGASNTTYIEKRDRLFDMLINSQKSVLLTAHWHSSATQNHTHKGKPIIEHTAPYFGGANGDDRTQGGGFIALLISPSKGILEVKTINKLML